MEEPQGEGSTSKGNTSQGQASAIAFKLVRKLHYQLMEELEVDREIRDLIEN
jgi:hypothetical protein